MKNQLIKKKKVPLSKVDAILSWEVNRESELGTDGSFRPMPIPCLYRTRAAHTSGQSPENLSPEAMGHARAWEASQRLIADTHTKSEREGKIKELMSTEEKQLSLGSKWHEDLFPRGKVLFTMATKGEDPHSGFFPLWWPVKRCAYPVVELITRSPMRRSIGRYNKHTTYKEKPRELIQVNLNPYSRKDHKPWREPAQWNTRDRVKK